MVWQLDQGQREQLIGVDLPRDPASYIKQINEPLGEIFQTWMENRTREGNTPVANLVDFLVRIDLGHDPTEIYEHFLGPEAETAGQPISWPSNYDIAAAINEIATYEVMSTLAEATNETVEKPSYQEYADAVRRAGELGLQWLGDVYVPSFVGEASIMAEEESKKLLEDLQRMTDEEGEEGEQQPLGEAPPDLGGDDLVAIAERQVGAVELDPVQMRTQILASWPSFASNLRDSNQQTLKNLDEDESGAHPLPLLVMENWVQVGDDLELLEQAQHQFLLDNCTRGSVWIPLKGGVFNPGTIAVAGAFTQDDKDRIVRRFGEFSKKAVEFR